MIDADIVTWLPRRMHDLGIVIPTLNEATGIEALLLSLQPLRAAGAELVVVDGGSSDDTRQRCQGLCDHLLTTTPSRGLQLRKGAEICQRPYLWFLHADSRVVAEAANCVLRALGDERGIWGRFDVRLSGSAKFLRVVQWTMNLRSRLTGIATGDQGIFVRRDALDRIGGFPNQPLMEDIELSRRLKRLARPRCLRTPLIQTSSRRWERLGVARVILAMWWFRLRYFAGASAEDLARDYYRHG